jgi:hypothetical protein
MLTILQYGIINAFVNYVYGEGLIDKGAEQCYTNVKIISKEDILLICQDYKTYEVMQRKLFGTH